MYSWLLPNQCWLLISEALDSYLGAFANRVPKMICSQIAKFMGPTWGPPGSCRPQVGPMMAPWTLLSGVLYIAQQGSLASSFYVHYNDVTMDAIVSQITSLTIVYSTVYSDADQRKHQSSASLAFLRGIHRWPVNPPHKWPVTLKMLPFDDVIMK